MTCIVGLEHGGKVYLGADSAGVDGLDLEVRADEKVFERGGMVFGFTSSFRMGQLLRYSLKVPKQKPGVTDAAFMSTVFVDAVRECLKKGGFAHLKEGVEGGGNFLVGYRGKLYAVEDDYQVSRQLPTESGRDVFWAVGCAHAIAKGSLFASPDTLAPKIKLKTALQAAERFSAGVRGPFNFVVSK